MTTTAALPAGFQARPATLDDLEAALRISRAQYLADYGEPDDDLTLESMRALVDAPAPKLWVVTAPDGQVVANAELKYGLSGTVPVPLICVLPEYQRRGIGSALLHLVEAEALSSGRAPEPPTQFLTQVSGRNTAAHRVLENSGYSLHSAFQIMELQMVEPPSSPAAIDGIEVRLFVVGQDEQAVYQADEEAFLDERGKQPRTYDVWSRRLQMDTDRFDPTLWYVAWDGSEIAGTSLNQVYQGYGEVMHLGVRRPWRRRGLGMALLLRVLGEFYRRGTLTVRLNVDSQSLTNAHQHYARAGFQVINSYRNYRKALPTP